VLQTHAYMSLGEQGDLLSHSPGWLAGWLDRGALPGRMYSLFSHMLTVHSSSAQLQSPWVAAYTICCLVLSSEGWLSGRNRLSMAEREAVWRGSTFGYYTTVGRMWVNSSFKNGGSICIHHLHRLSTLTSSSLIHLIIIILRLDEREPTLSLRCSDGACRRCDAPHRVMLQQLAHFFSFFSFFSSFFGSTSTKLV
jgi:hypothetical protein